MSMFQSFAESFKSGIEKLVGQDGSEAGSETRSTAGSDFTDRDDGAIRRQPSNPWQARYLSSRDANATKENGHDRGETNSVAASQDRTPSEEDAELRARREEELAGSVRRHSGEVLPLSHHLQDRSEASGQTESAAREGAEKQEEEEYREVLSFGDVLDRHEGVALESDGVESEGHTGGYNLEGGQNGRETEGKKAEAEGGLALGNGVGPERADESEGGERVSAHEAASSAVGSIQAQQSQAEVEEAGTERHSDAGFDAGGGRGEHAENSSDRRGDEGTAREEGARPDAASSSAVVQPASSVGARTGTDGAEVGRAAKGESISRRSSGHHHRPPALGRKLLEAPPDIPPTPHGMEGRMPGAPQPKASSTQAQPAPPRVVQTSPWPTHNYVPSGSSATAITSAPTTPSVQQRSPGQARVELLFGNLRGERGREGGGMPVTPPGSPVLAPADPWAAGAGGEVREETESNGTKEALGEGAADRPSNPPTPSGADGSGGERSDRTEGGGKVERRIGGRTLLRPPSVPSTPEGALRMPPPLQLQLAATSVAAPEQPPATAASADDAVEPEPEVQAVGERDDGDGAGLAASGERSGRASVRDSLIPQPASSEQAESIADEDAASMAGDGEGEGAGDGGDEGVEEDGSEEERGAKGVGEEKEEQKEEEQEEEEQDEEDSEEEEEEADEGREPEADGDHARMAETLSDTLSVDDPCIREARHAAALRHVPLKQMVDLANALIADLKAASERGKTLLASAGSPEELFDVMDEDEDGRVGLYELRDTIVELDIEALLGATAETLRRFGDEVDSLYLDSEGWEWVMNRAMDPGASSGEEDGDMQEEEEGKEAKTSEGGSPPPSPPASPSHARVAWKIKVDDIEEDGGRDEQEQEPARDAVRDELRRRGSSPRRMSSDPSPNMPRSPLFHMRRMASDGNHSPRIPRVSSGSSAWSAIGRLQSVERLTRDIVESLESRGLDADEAFDLFDADSSAALDLEELRDTVKELGIVVEMSEIKNWFQRMAAPAEKEAERVVSRDKWVQALSARRSPERVLFAREVVARTGRESEVCDRALKVMSVGLYLRGLHLPDDRWRAFANEEEVLCCSSVLKTVEEWLLDVSYQDVEDVCWMLQQKHESMQPYKRPESKFTQDGEDDPSATDLEPEVLLWALPELHEIRGVIQSLGVMCSALHHDSLDIQDGFDDCVTRAGVDRFGGMGITMSLQDLQSLADRWQLELTTEDVNDMFNYMDSAHNGRVTRQSWQMALSPVYDILAWGLNAIVDLTREQGLGIQQAYERFVRKDQQHGSGLSKSQLALALRALAPDWISPPALLRVLHLHMADSADGRFISLNGWRRSLQVGHFLRSDEHVQLGASLVLLPGTKWERPITYQWFGMLQMAASTSIADMPMQLLLTSRVPEDYGQGQVDSSIDLVGVGKKQKEAYVVSGRVESNSTVELTLYGQAWSFGSLVGGTVLRCEGVVEGRLMRGTWQSGAVQGHFYFLLMSCIISEQDDLGLQSCLEVERTVSAMSQASSSFKIVSDMETQQKSFKLVRESSVLLQEGEASLDKISAMDKLIWTAAKCVFDEQCVQMEAGMVRSVNGRTSVVQHKIALGRESAFFEVVLLDDDKSKDMDCVLSIGIASQDCAQRSEHVGLQENSVSFHTSTGQIFNGKPTPSEGLYVHAGVGDVVGCGVHFAEPGGKDSSVTNVFWTKNGALIGSVSFGQWGKAMGIVHASVGIEGEGSRVVIMNSRLPPLLKYAFGGCCEVEEPPAAEVDMWCGVVESDDRSVFDILVQVVAIASGQGQTPSSGAVDLAGGMTSPEPKDNPRRSRDRDSLELRGDGRSAEASWIVSGKVERGSSVKLSIHGSAGGQIRGKGTVKDRCMQGTWVSGTTSGRFCLHLISPTGICNAEERAAQGTGSSGVNSLKAAQSTRRIGSVLRQDSLKTMRDRDSSSERIASWNNSKAVWAESKVEMVEEDVSVEGGLVMVTSNRTSVVQHKVALSREHSYFEVLLLDASTSKDKECAVSVGVAGGDYVKSETHVGAREGSVGYYVHTGGLHIGRDRTTYDLYADARAGDMVGCGVLYAENGGKEAAGRPSCVFWTRNGTVIGCVNVASWKQLKAPLFASVGLHGEGTRVVTFSSVVPPLLEMVMAGAELAEKASDPVPHGLICNVSGSQTWCGVLDSFDDCSSEIMVQALATSEGGEDDDVVMFNLLGEGKRENETFLVTGSIGQLHEASLLLSASQSDVASSETITCEAAVKGREMRGSWHRGAEAGTVLLYLVGSENVEIGEDTEGRASPVTREDMTHNRRPRPVMELDGTQLKLDGIAKLDESSWSDNNSNYDEDVMGLQGGMVWSPQTEDVQVVQHSFAMCRDYAFFEVLLLDDDAKPGGSFSLSVGIAYEGFEREYAHIGTDAGSIGFRIDEGVLNIYDVRPVRTQAMPVNSMGGEGVGAGDAVGCGCVFADPGGRENKITNIFWTLNGAVICSLDIAGHNELPRPVHASVAIEGEGNRVVIYKSSPPPLLSLLLAGSFQSEDMQATQASFTQIMAESKAENSLSWAYASNQGDCVIRPVSVAENFGDYHSDMQLADDREFRRTAVRLAKLLPDTKSTVGLGGHFAYHFFDSDGDTKMSFEDLHDVLEELVPGRFLRADLEHFHRRICKRGGDDSEVSSKELWSSAMRVALSRDLPLQLWREEERSARFMCGLLVSCELSIEDGFELFSHKKKEISFEDFGNIFRNLFHDWLDFSDYQLVTLFSQFARHGSISRPQWNHVLLAAAELPDISEHCELLLRPAAHSSPDQLAPAPRVDAANKSFGERQRLRDIFSEAMGGSRVGAVIHRERLTLALSKMGISQSHEDQMRGMRGSRGGPAARMMDKAETRGGVRRKPEGNKQVQAEYVTYMDLERAVEQSRLETTLEQSAFHRVLAEELMKHKPLVTAWTRQRIIEQVYSPHLFGWLTELQDRRLQELLERVFHDVKVRMTNEMKKRVLQLKVSDDAVTDVTSNSKYATWTGTFEGGTVEGSFGKLDQFKQGLDSYIGFPSPNVETAIRIEHCQSSDSTAEFVAPNNKDLITTPAKEYWLVLSDLKSYPGNRRGGAVHKYLKHPRAKRAGLTLVEVIALRLYTGPMYVKYNAVLRNIGTKKANHYVTTIHAIVSGIIKLSAVWVLPPSRKVYRGLNGVELPREFWEKDEFGCKGGVEYGLMSTTTDISVAIQYSSGRVPTIFEINVGQVDRGAELSWISQYWQENEVLIPPLSNLEVVGNPHLRTVPISASREMQVLVVPLKVNVNIKSKSLEELVATRKTVFQTALRDLQSELKQEIVDMALAMGEAEALDEGDNEETEWFNDHLSLAELGRSSTTPSISAQVSINRRRKDLNELIEGRVNTPGAQFAHAIFTLEHREWAETFESLRDAGREANVERFRRLLVERETVITELRSFVDSHWDFKNNPQLAKESFADILEALETDSGVQSVVEKTDSNYWREAVELLEETVEWWSGEGGVHRLARMEPPHFLFDGEIDGRSAGPAFGSWGDGIDMGMALRVMSREVKRLVIQIAIQLILQHPNMDAIQLFDEYARREEDAEEGLTGVDLHGWVITGVLETLPLYVDAGEVWVATLAPCLMSIVEEGADNTREAWAALMMLSMPTEILRGLKTVKEKLFDMERGSHERQAHQHLLETTGETSAGSSMTAESLATVRLLCLERCMETVRQTLGILAPGAEPHASSGINDGELSGMRRRTNSDSRDAPSKRRSGGGVGAEGYPGALDGGASRGDGERNRGLLEEAFGAERVWNIMLSLFRRALQAVDASCLDQDEFGIEDRMFPSPAPPRAGGVSMGLGTGTGTGTPFHATSSADLSPRSPRSPRGISTPRAVARGFSPLATTSVMFESAPEDSLRPKLKRLTDDAHKLLEAKRKLAEMFSRWTRQQREKRTLLASRKSRSMDKQAHAFNDLRRRIQQGYPALFTTSFSWFLGSHPLRWYVEGGRSQFAPDCLPTFKSGNAGEIGSQVAGRPWDETTGATGPGEGRELLEYSLCYDECYDASLLLEDLRNIAREAQGVLEMMGKERFYKKELSRVVQTPQRPEPSSSGGAHLRTAFGKESDELGRRFRAQRFNSREFGNESPPPEHPPDRRNSAVEGLRKSRSPEGHGRKHSQPNSDNRRSSVEDKPAADGSTTDRNQSKWRRRGSGHFSSSGRLTESPDGSRLSRRNSMLQSDDGSSISLEEPQRYVRTRRASLSHLENLDGGSTLSLTAGQLRDSVTANPRNGFDGETTTVAALPKFLGEEDERVTVTRGRRMSLLNNKPHVEEDSDKKDEEEDRGGAEHHEEKADPDELPTRFEELITGVEHAIQVVHLRVVQQFETDYWWMQATAKGGEQSAEYLRMQHEKLMLAHRLGGLAAKEAQATMQYEEMERLALVSERSGLSQHRTSRYHMRPSWVTCRRSLREEFWMLDGVEPPAANRLHLQRVLAWMRRMSVASELRRLLQSTPDSVLTHPACERRFSSAILCLETACRMCPLTDLGDDIGTEDKYNVTASTASTYIKKLSRDREKDVRQGQLLDKEEMKLLESRLERRWRIRGRQKSAAAAAAERGGFGAELSADFLRAESMYWKSRITLLYQGFGKSLRRRSVLRCLELMDDTSLDWDTDVQPPREVIRQWNELQVDDVSDLWEARMLGMLCVRAESVLSSDQGALPVIEIASGEKGSVRLKRPLLHKTACFLAFFVAASAPNNVKVEVSDDDGNDAMTIVLRPDGGVGAHTTQGEDGRVMLNFPKSIVSVDSLRLLLEAARADHSILHTTVAGLNEVLEPRRGEMPGGPMVDAADKADAKEQQQCVEEMRLLDNEDLCKGEDGGREAMNLMGNLIITVAPKLRVLHLGCNKMRDTGMEELASFLAIGAAPFLTELNIGNNEIGDQGALYLSEALRPGPPLQVMTLSMNDIGFKGAIHVARALPRIPNLRVLDLSFNHVSSIGTVALGAGMARCSTLTALNLTDNDIGDFGVTELAERLAPGGRPMHALSKVQALRLSKNKITSVGASNLIKVFAIDAAPNLSVLTLTGNMITPEGMEEMTSNMQLAIEKTLQTLCVEKQQAVHGIELYDLDPAHLSELRQQLQGGQVGAKVDRLRTAVLHLRTDLLREGGLEAGLEGGIVSLNERLQELEELKEKLDSTKAGEATTSGADQQMTTKQWRQQWRRHKLTRLRAVSKLKRAWLQAGRQLNQLNRESLHENIKKAVKGFTAFADAKTDEPAERYLEDRHYIEALRESLDMKQSIKDEFRSRLVSAVMKPLREGGGEAQNVEPATLLAGEECVQALSNMWRLNELLVAVDRQMHHDRQWGWGRLPVFSDQAVKEALRDPRLKLNSEDGDHVSAAAGLEELHRPPLEDVRERVEGAPWQKECLRRPWAFHAQLRDLWCFSFGPERFMPPTQPRIGSVFYPEGSYYWQEAWRLVQDVEAKVEELKRTHPTQLKDRYKWGKAMDPRLRWVIEELAAVAKEGLELMMQCRSDMENGEPCSKQGYTNAMEEVVEVCRVLVDRARRLRFSWCFARDLAKSTLERNEALLAEAFRMSSGLEELFDMNGMGLIKDTFQPYESATGDETPWWMELAQLVTSVVRVMNDDPEESFRKMSLQALAEFTRNFLRDQTEFWETHLHGVVTAAERRLAEGAAELQSVVRRRCREVTHRAERQQELQARTQLATKFAYTLPALRLPLRLAVQVFVSVVGRRVRILPAALKERGWDGSVGEGVVVEVRREAVWSRCKVEVAGGGNAWLMTADVSDVGGDAAEEGLRNELRAQVAEVKAIYEMGGAHYKGIEVHELNEFLKEQGNELRESRHHHVHQQGRDIFAWLKEVLRLSLSARDGKLVTNLEKSFGSLLDEEQKDFLQFVTHRIAMAKADGSQTDSESRSHTNTDADTESSSRGHTGGGSSPLLDHHAARRFSRSPEPRGPPVIRGRTTSLSPPRSGRPRSMSTLKWDLEAARAERGEAHGFTISADGSRLTYSDGPRDVRSLFFGRNWKGVAGDHATYQAVFRFVEVKTWVGIGAVQTDKQLHGFAPWECGKKHLGQQLLCKGASGYYKGLYTFATGSTQNFRSLVGPGADSFIESIKTEPRAVMVKAGDEVCIEVDPKEGRMTFFVNGAQVHSLGGRRHRPFYPYVSACAPGVVVELLPVETSKLAAGTESEEELGLDVLVALEKACNGATRRGKVYKESCRGLQLNLLEYPRIVVTEIFKDCLRRLPSTLLAQPQCCRRLRAATSCLAKACRALPLLPVRDCDNVLDFLVPPLEREGHVHSVVRCLELLQKGTACSLQRLSTTRPRAAFDRLRTKLGCGSWLDGRLGSKALVSTNDRDDPGILIGAEMLTRGRWEIEFVVEDFDYLVVGVCDDGIHEDKWEGSSSLGRGQVCVWGKPLTKDQDGNELQPDEEEFYWHDGDLIRIELDLGNGYEPDGRVKFSRGEEILGEVKCSKNGVYPFLRLGNGVVTFQKLSSSLHHRFPRRRSSGTMELMSQLGLEDPTSQGELSIAVATAACPLEVESVWEARVFASMCVTTHQVEDFKVRRLSTGELTHVTLRTGEIMKREAAFIAHFVARACRKHVTVKVEGELGTSEVILSPGGGLGPYELKQMAREADDGGEGEGGVLALAGLGLTEESLYLLMEAALAAREDAILKPELSEPKASGDGSDSPLLSKKASPMSGAGQGGKGQRGSQVGEAAAADAGQKEMMGAPTLRRASLLLRQMTQGGQGGTRAESVRATKLGPGQRSSSAKPPGQSGSDSKGADAGEAGEGDKLVIRGIELNGNGWLGHGGRDGMVLMVQLSMLTAGENLLRLHLDNTGVSDDGVDALAGCLEGGFAPRLQVLWLNDNEITDRGAARLAGAVAVCMDEVQELYLYRNPIGGGGKRLLRDAFRHKTAKVLLSEGEKRRGEIGGSVPASTSNTKTVPWRLRL